MPLTAGGFSGFTPNNPSFAALEYVKMPAWLETDPAPAEFLAHELGHYFGLDHTARDVNVPVPAYAANTWLTDAGGDPTVAFDADKLADTLPDPGYSEFAERTILAGTPGWENREGCAGSDTISITYGPISGRDLPSVDVRVDRSNMMAYYFRCHIWPITVTPSQLGRLRTTLNLRTHLQ